MRWHMPSRKEITMLMRYLSMRFMSCRPSPLRKRSRLELSIRQEHRESNRFSIISCSSAVLGLCLLNTWMTNKAKLPPNVWLCWRRTHVKSLHQKLQHLTGVSQWPHVGPCCILSVAAALTGHPQMCSSPGKDLKDNTQGLQGEGQFTLKYVDKLITREFLHSSYLRVLQAALPEEIQVSYEHTTFSQLKHGQLCAWRGARWRWTNSNPAYLQLAMKL